MLILNESDWDYRGTRWTLFFKLTLAYMCLNTVIGLEWFNILTALYFPLL